MIKDRCCARPVVRRYIPFSPPTRKKKRNTWPLKPACYELHLHGCLTTSRRHHRLVAQVAALSRSETLRLAYTSFSFLFFLYIIFVGHLLTDLLFILTFFRFNEEEEEEEAPGLYLWPSRAAGCQVASLSLSFFLSLSR